MHMVGFCEPSPQDARVDSGEKSTIGQRIRSRRKELNIGQAQLGDLINRRGQQVFRYEMDKSKPSAEATTELAKHLNVSERWLTTGEDQAQEDVAAPEGDPPYEAWAEFVLTPEYRAAPAEDKEAARVLRFPPDRVPKVMSYQMYLMALATAPKK